MTVFDSLEINEIVEQNPQTLLLVGPPKSGKTKSCCELTTTKDFVLIDLEYKDGSDYQKGRKLKLVDWAKQTHPNRPLWQVFYLLLIELKKSKTRQGIIIDNTTILEQFAKDWALHDFNKSDIGQGMIKKRKVEGLEPIADPYNLPNGLGYGLTREKFMIFKNMIEENTEYVIYIAHLKNKVKTFSVDENDSLEININEIDLTGQLKRIMVQNVSCTGYVYRVGDTTKVSFKTDDTQCMDVGSRSPHLDNYEGVLDWNHIYKF